MKAWFGQPIRSYRKRQGQYIVITRKYHGLGSHTILWEVREAQSTVTPWAGRIILLCRKMWVYEKMYNFQGEMLGHEASLV